MVEQVGPAEGIDQSFPDTLTEMDSWNQTATQFLLWDRRYMVSWIINKTIAIWTVGTHVIFKDRRKYGEIIKHIFVN